MTKILSLVLVLVMAVSCIVACGPSGDPNGDSGKTYEIKLWVSTTKGVVEFTQKQVEDFKRLHPEYNFNITVEAVGEGEAAGLVLADVATAPDMFCFAQDQLPNLVQGGALSPLGAQATSTVTSSNDAGSVAAATMNNKVYAYPLTSDNGYYLYYDSSVVSDEDAKTVEGILAACKKAGKLFAYNSTNGWYTAAYFFAQRVGTTTPICTSTWSYEGGSKPTAFNDNFNSDNGLIAMKGMAQLTTHESFVDTDKIWSGTAAFISGTWAVGDAKGEYGDNMKATKLPTFKVDGVEYQMGSFSGVKLIGCKPQEDATKAKLCADLALYLTSGEAQLERYFEFQWGPSNLEAQADENVQENPLLAALLMQSSYAQPQGVIPSEWWTEMTALGEIAKTPGKTADDFRAALVIYEQKNQAVLNAE